MFNENTRIIVYIKKTDLQLELKVLKQNNLKSSGMKLIKQRTNEYLTQQPK